MCSYFEQHLRKQGLNPFPDLPPQDIRRRARPTDPAYTIDAEGGRDRSWSLIPPWAKTRRLKYPTFNARAETVAEKPVFRHAWRSSQRCLIPVSAFFEWPVVDGKKRIHRLRTPANEPLWLAGLWELWQGEDETIDSCTVLTCEPRADLAWVHNRMPRVLNPDELDLWLHGAPEEAAALLAEGYQGDIVAEPESDQARDRP